MRKTALLLLTLFILAFLLLSSTAVLADYKDSLFYVLDKRAETVNSKTVFMLVFVHYKPGEQTYADFVEHHRFRFEVSSDVYDLFAKGGKYPLSELQAFGLEIKAEAEEEQMKEITLIKEARRKAREEKEKKEKAAIEERKKKQRAEFEKLANALPEKAEEVKEFALGIAQDGKVTSREIEKLGTRAESFLGHKQELVWKNPEYMSRIKEEHAELFELAERAEKINSIYNRNAERKKFSDNRRHEIAGFFQEITGMEKVSIQSKKDWGVRFKEGPLAGLMIGFIVFLFATLIALFIISFTPVVANIVQCITLSLKISGVLAGISFICWTIYYLFIW